MDFKHLISILLYVSIIIRVAVIKDLQDASVITISLLFILSMIWFSDLWATYILPFGWLESKAKDFKNAAYSAPAIAFIGWGLLLLTMYFIFFQTI